MESEEDEDKKYEITLQGDSSDGSIVDDWLILD